MTARVVDTNRFRCAAFPLMAAVTTAVARLVPAIRERSDDAPADATGAARAAPPILGVMPRYEYRCRTCAETFELRRPMSESDAPATCPAGHVETMRLLSVFASVGTASASGAAAAPAAPCGGHCACHPG
jgi:putative FmdB family regulatory protein